MKFMNIDKVHIFFSKTHTRQLNLQGSLIMKNDELNETTSTLLHPYIFVVAYIVNSSRFKKGKQNKERKTRSYLKM